MVSVGCSLLGLLLANACATSGTQAAKLRNGIYSVGLEAYGNEPSAAFYVETLVPILDNPKLYARLAKLHESPEVASGLAGQKTGIVELTAAGLRRLDRTDQAALLEVKRVLAARSLPLCAGFWTGNVPSSALMEGLRTLDEAQQRTWITVTLRALSLEIEAEGPLSAIAEADTEQALTELADSVGPEAYAALAAAVEKDPPAPEAACHAFRVISRGVKNLPPGKQMIVIRSLVEPGVPQP